MSFIAVGEPKTFDGRRGTYALQHMRDDGPPFNIYCFVTLPDGGGQHSFTGAVGWTSDDGAHSGIYSKGERYEMAERDCRQLAKQFDLYQFDPARFAEQGWA
jgi:hypothetical protein